MIRRNFLTLLGTRSNQRRIFGALTYGPLPGRRKVQRGGRVAARSARAAARADAPYWRVHESTC
jgi:hypothetical protein